MYNTARQPTTVSVYADVTTCDQRLLASPWNAKIIRSYYAICSEWTTCPIQRTLDRACNNCRGRKEGSEVVAKYCQHFFSPFSFTFKVFDMPGKKLSKKSNSTNWCGWNPL